jgi:hypothetical protein
MFTAAWASTSSRITASRASSSRSYGIFPMDAAATKNIINRGRSIGLLVHAATTVATFRLIVDPWGLISGEPQHLFFAAIPILAAFIVLYLLRDLDYFSFDGWQARKVSPVR